MFFTGLSKELEGAGHAAEAVATFLMRAISTMFAEDVGLVPNTPAERGA